MKLSVSLPADDVTIIDAYVKSAGLPSRSAAVQHAVRMLRLPELEQDYRAAWEEWEASGAEAEWSVTGGDGVTDAAR